MLFRRRVRLRSPPLDGLSVMHRPQLLACKHGVPCAEPGVGEAWRAYSAELSLLAADAMQCAQDVVTVE